MTDDDPHFPLDPLIERLDWRTLNERQTHGAPGPLHDEEGNPFRTVGEDERIERILDEIEEFTTRMATEIREARGAGPRTTSPMPDIRERWRNEMRAYLEKAFRKARTSDPTS